MDLTKNADFFVELLRGGYINLENTDENGNNVLQVAILVDEHLALAVLDRLRLTPAKIVYRVVNHKNVAGDTPLHIATRGYPPQSELLQQLFTFKPKTDVPNKNGERVRVAKSWDHYYQKVQHAQMSETPVVIEVANPGSRTERFVVPVNLF